MTQKAETWLSKALFAVYSNAVNGKAHNGGSIPEFEEIAGSALKGWTAVADYVAERSYKDEARQTLSDVLLLMWRNGESCEDVTIHTNPEEHDLFLSIVVDELGMNTVTIIGEHWVQKGNVWASIRRKIKAGLSE